MTQASKHGRSSNVAHQKAGVFETWRDAKVVGLAIEQGADVEVVQGKGHGRHLNEPALDAYPEGEGFWGAGCVHVHEVGIGGLGAVLCPLYGSGESPGLVAHPRVY